MLRSPAVSKSVFYLQIHLKMWHQSKNWSERGNVRRRELQSGIPWPPSQWTKLGFTMLLHTLLILGPPCLFLGVRSCQTPFKQRGFPCVHRSEKAACLIVVHFTQQISWGCQLFSYRLQSVTTNLNSVDLRTLPKCYFKQYIFQLLSLILPENIGAINI